jgi:hypothetical protein
MPPRLNDFYRLAANRQFVATTAPICVGAPITL